MIRTIRLAALVTALLALAACQDDGKKTTKSCGSDAECAGGICFDSECYTACQNQDQCGPDEFCVRKTSGDEQADVCVTAADYAGCTGDLDCASLVVRTCDVARCDLEQTLCYVADADDGTTCTSGGAEGTCRAGACEIDTSCVPTGADLDLCDGVDDDCDGGTDEDHVVTEVTCGIGACEVPGHKVCEAGAEVVQCAPGLPPDEVDDSCDGVDSDCDGETDEEYVLGETGYGCGVGACARQEHRECLDGEARNVCEPGEPLASDDATCDGIDDDCDGAVDEDYGPMLTTCGVGPCAAEGALACVDGQPVDTCEPLQPGVGLDPECNGVDDDCDGVADDDFEPEAVTCGVGACLSGGFSACVEGVAIDDCVPGEPAADDVSCDGVDDDCDGEADNGYGVHPSTCGVGACAAVGEVSCLGGELRDTCAPGVAPSVDDTTCDGIDDDCDGLADDELAVELPDGSTVFGHGQPCGVGACAGGLTECFGGGDAIPSLVCSTLVGKVGGEVCNAIDDDCDGLTDAADLDLESDPDRRCELGDGVCEGSMKPIDHCQAGAWQPCTTADYLAWSPSYQAGAEVTCDGVDNDCDTSADEDFSVTLPDGAVVVGPGLACGTGVCAGGTTECVDGGLVCSRLHLAAAEECDAEDDDCDGLVDEAEDLPCGPDLMCLTHPAIEGTGCVQCFDDNEVRWDGCDFTVLAETQVNTTTTHDEHRPAVAVLADGGFAVTWTSNDTQTYSQHIFGGRYGADGKAVSGELQVSPVGDSAMHRISRVAPTPDGGFTVLWGNQYTQLMWRSYDADTAPVSEAVPFGDMSYGITTWDLAGDLASGRVVAVWDTTDQQTYVSSIHGQGFAEGAASVWGPELLSAVEPAVSEREPRVAVFPDGHAVVVWDDDKSLVHVRLVSADGKPSATVDLVSTSTAEGAGLASPTVAVFPDGSFVVAYRTTQYNEMGRSFDAPRFPADGKPDGAPVRVDSLGFDDSRAPEVAAFADGGFVVVFPAQVYDDPRALDVYARWFLKDDSPRDVEQAVNTYLPGDQHMARVAAFPDGAALVTWASCDIYGAVSVAQDGASCGIYLQRFSGEGKRLAH